MRGTRTPTARGRATSRCAREATLKLARTLATALIATGLLASAAHANIDSAVGEGSTIALPPGHELYFYLAATDGGQPIEAISWLEGQDLAVNADNTSAQAISIGHDPYATGAYLSGALVQATAAIGLDGYAVTQVITAQAHRRAHQSGHPGKALRGAGVTLRFRTVTANQLVVILVGTQGSGTPKLSGIKATPLQDTTYGSPASSEIASAATYAVQLRAGKHKATVTTLTYIPSGGSAIGAVAYVLTPTG